MDDKNYQDHKHKVLIRRKNMKVVMYDDLKNFIGSSLYFGSQAEQIPFRRSAPHQYINYLYKDVEKAWNPFNGLDVNITSAVKEKLDYCVARRKIPRVRREFVRFMRLVSP